MCVSYDKQESSPGKKYYIKYYRYMKFNLSFYCFYQECHKEEKMRLSNEVPFIAATTLYKDCFETLIPWSPELVAINNMDQTHYIAFNNIPFHFVSPGMLQTQVRMKHLMNFWMKCPSWQPSSASTRRVCSFSATFIWCCGWGRPTDKYVWFDVSRSITFFGSTWATLISTRVVD